MTGPTSGGEARQQHAADFYRRAGKFMRAEDITPAQAPADLLADWIRDEQMHLWTDLGEAIRYAANGAWSMGAANIAVRIASAARLVGPTPYGEIPWTLVTGGVYATLLGVIGLPANLPDDAELRRVDALMSGHGPTHEVARLQFAQTRAAITSPREARFIRDGAE